MLVKKSPHKDEYILEWSEKTSNWKCRFLVIALFDCSNCEIKVIQVRQGTGSDEISIAGFWNKETYISNIDKNNIKTNPVQILKPNNETQDLILPDQISNKGPTEIPFEESTLSFNQSSECSLVFGGHLYYVFHCIRKSQVRLSKIPLTEPNTPLKCVEERTFDTQEHWENFVLFQINGYIVMGHESLEEDHIRFSLNLKFFEPTKLILVDELSCLIYPKKFYVDRYSDLLFTNPLFKVDSKAFHGIRTFRSQYSQKFDFLIFTTHKRKVKTFKVPLNEDKYGLIQRGDVEISNISAYKEKARSVRLFLRQQQITTSDVLQLKLRW